MYGINIDGKWKKKEKFFFAEMLKFGITFYFNSTCRQNPVQGLVTYGNPLYIFNLLHFVNI